jgi:hypothetical protein
VSVILTSNRIHLNSNDLLTSVNTILHTLKLPTIETTNEDKANQQSGIKFKIIEIDKHYDFTRIPKVSIEYERSLVNSIGQYQ